MAEFASNAKGNAALTTGIIGTAGAALPLLNGLLGGMGGNCVCSEDHYVNRYELGLQNEIAAKDSKISLLESNIYVDSKIADVYERLNTKIGGLEAQICQQNVYNATNTAAIACINGQIAQLMGLTKTVIPNTSICPGWGNVTVTPSTTTTGA
jgi:hypothetical protein